MQIGPDISSLVENRNGENQRGFLNHHSYRQPVVPPPPTPGMCRYNAPHPCPVQFAVGMQCGSSSADWMLVSCDMDCLARIDSLCSRTATPHCCRLYPSFCYTRRRTFKMSGNSKEIKNKIFRSNQAPYRRSPSCAGKTRSARLCEPVLLLTRIWLCHICISQGSELPRSDGVMR